MTSDRYLSVEGGAGRLQQFARVTTELLEAHDVDAVCGIVTGHLTAAAGADGGSMSLLVGDELVLAGLRGGAPGAADRYSTYPLDAATPAGDALRSGRPLTLVGRDAILARYPDLPLAAEGDRSIICLPMISGGRPMGVASLSFAGRRDVDAAEATFLMMLADVCAHALDRVSALRSAADREAKLDFLAAASAELAADLDYESTLRTVAEMAVPWFADWCTIAVAQDGVLHTLAVAHRDPAHADVIEELQRCYPPSPDPDRGAYAVFRTGRSDLAPDLDDELLRSVAQDDHHYDLLRQLEFRSAMACPLVGGDEVLGVVTWVTGAGGRRFGPEDLAFGEDLARRAAMAIENARLHQAVRGVQAQLQRAVLTQDLPQLPEVSTAVEYRPAGRIDVGGDFYDAFPLPDGRLVAFVGDVEGRGLAAATTMAHVRAAVRTLVALEPTPSQVMTNLDRVFATLGLPGLVTLVLAFVDPQACTIEVCNAGHLPALVRSASGAVDYLDAPGLLLGVEDCERASVVVPFTPGDAVVLYTDGLVERRGEHLDDGLARLAEYVERSPVADPHDWVRALVDDHAPPTLDDDVAALLLVRPADAPQSSTRSSRWTTSRS